MKKNKYENLILREESVKYFVKDEEIETIEKYYMDLNTNERVFDRNLSIENDIRAYDVYKNKKGLLTANEIKKIRKKYDLTQKEYALAIGVGEITVHRFENGTIQTESIDAIIRLSDNPNNMLQLLIQNKEKIEENLFEKTKKTIENMLNYENHRIADIDYAEISKMDFKTEDINTVAEAIIQEYNVQVEADEKVLLTELPKITPLELQKDLYFVDGISLAIFGKTAFLNEIKAWEHGPVIEEVYYKYKNYGSKEIYIENKPVKLSRGLKEIIKKVIEGYSKFSGGQLIEITHNEMPWQTTRKNEVISKEKMKEYFTKVYKNT